MRKYAIAVLTALIVAICSPLAVISVAPADDIPYLAALDVCSTSHAAMSVNAESPVIQECLSGLPPLACIGYMDRKKLSYHPAIFAVKEDRPPIV